MADTRLQNLSASTTLNSNDSVLIISSSGQSKQNVSTFAKNIDFNDLSGKVSSLTANDDNSAIQAFPKASISSAVDLDNVYIGDFTCKTLSYLTNAPSGLTAPVRITVYSRTRDGLSDPDALTSTMHRTQEIVDANGKVFARQMKRTSGGTVTWTAWQDRTYGATMLQESKDNTVSSTDTIVRAARTWYGRTAKVSLRPAGHFLVLINQTAIYLGWFAGDPVEVNFTRVGGEGGVTATASLFGTVLTITASQNAAITVLYFNGEKVN